jgi:hypothetical protein
VKELKSSLSSGEEEAYYRKNLMKNQNFWQN